jgi:aryl-alcohol dehydrogenase-like predicted oxidoreductase
MEYTTIPSLNAKISRIGLGTWAIGGSLWGGTDEKESILTIRKALEMGINFIDTAPAYGKGTAEEIVGKAIKEHGNRQKIIIATKCGLNQETDNVFRDSSRASIIKEVEDSLRRLQVDYIDLYQVHWPDPATPLSETAEVLNTLLQHGKIRAIGVSNFTIEQMIEFRKKAPIHALQPPFNIFERETENALLGFCLESDIAIIGYSSLCRGLLSGKMTIDRQFKGDDFRKGMDPKFKEPLFSEYVKAADALKEWVQKKYHRSLPALAVRWVLDSDINIALWGARKPDQLNEVDGVLGWELTDADFREIDKIIEFYIKRPIEPVFMSPAAKEGSIKL